MTTPAYSTVTTELITSYGSTVKHIVQAYRAGGERLADFIEQRWSAALGQPRDPLGAEVRKNAQVTHDLVGSVYHRGLAFTASSADTVIDKLVELASHGVQQAAANAARFEERVGVSTLDKLAQAAVPAALAATKLASRIEAKSGEWAQQMVDGQAAPTKRPSAFAKARSRHRA